MSLARRGIGVLVAALATLVVLPAAPASAHAVVVDTYPANGQEVDAPPTAVVVTFDEAVTSEGGGLHATVIDADGEAVEGGAATLDRDRRTLTIPLPHDLPHGAYIASWSVVSADSHPVGGSLQFGYGQPASTVVAAAAIGPAPVLTLLTGITKGALYLALVAAFGLLPAAWLLGADGVELRRVRRIAAVGVVVAAAVSAAQVLVQRAWVGSAAPDGPPALGDVLRTAYVGAVGVRLGALAAALVVLVVLGRALRPVADTRRATVAAHIALAVLGAVVLATVVANGHGGAGPWWRFLVAALHGSAAVAWLGGLALLGWFLLRHRLDRARLLRMHGWSVYAGTCVGVLAATGLVQGVVGVRFTGALLTTTYGVLLLAKLVPVAIAAGLATTGWRWTRRQRRFERPEPGQTARLRARVRAEAGLAAVVVVLSGVLSSVTPAEAAWAPVVEQHATVGPYAVTFAVGPARRGPESFRITAVQATGKAPLPQSVALVLRQDDGVQGLRARFPYRIAGTLAPGRPTPVTFTSEALSIPATGRWTATLTVAASDYEQYTADFSYDVE